MVVFYTSFLPLCSTFQLVTAAIILILENGRCSYDAYPEAMWNATTPGDLSAIQLRTAFDVPRNAAFFEGAIGLLVAYVPEVVIAAGDIVPGILILVLLIVRVHSIGLFGCDLGDVSCCPALDCPKEAVTSSIHGCGDGALVYWRCTDNFCPWPLWYESYKAQCGSLGNSPDYSQCYRYGCEYDPTPLRWAANRVWLIGCVLILLGVVRVLITRETSDFIKSKKKV